MHEPVSSTYPPRAGRGRAGALEEVGAPYDVRLVSFEAVKQPAHMALQPFGQIPTYEEGELVLFESGAIVLHIAERHSGLLPHDADVMLDPRSNTLLFGDGRRGLTAPKDSRVFVRFATTLGAAGNLESGSITGTAPSLRNWLLFQPALSTQAEKPAQADVEPILKVKQDTAWARLRPTLWSAQDALMSP